MEVLRKLTEYFLISCFVDNEYTSFVDLKNTLGALTYIICLSLLYKINISGTNA